MSSLGTLPYLRPSQASDDGFLYDVFATTWESEVAALPNQNLARHVLRIQHIAQERRFEGRYPGYRRFVVMEDGRAAGRLYLHRKGPHLHVVDLTLMPDFRSRGIGSRIFRDLFHLAAKEGYAITLRVGRRNRRATDLYTSLGFRLTNVDDLDNYFEWVPVQIEEQHREQSSPQSSSREDSARVR